jgi:peptide methionine sulfoxide reductase msrA/msrB
MEKFLGIASEILKGAALIAFIPAVLGAAPKYETATFAGGCFWCTQPVFEYLKGVIKVEAGYANGRKKNPTYEDYMDKGYVEAVQVTYDPAVISYAQLVSAFWEQIDPTDAGGQFYDRGPQYRPAIFYHNETQKKEAERSKGLLEKSGKFSASIKVSIEKYINFFPAEGYHQDYSKKNPLQYNMYRLGSGRDAFLKKIWGKDADKKH